jgi:oligoribonuclease NrnB/cAMP/cGMP phosphodiesterase (DHH superfamily)
MKKPITVLYHAECPDGFGAAYAAWKKIGSRADYLPVKYGNPPPAGLINKQIYIVDFSFPEDILGLLVKNNKKVVVLDHHISSQNRLGKASEYVFDLKHSGAYLAWKYFHPRLPIPLLIKYLEDQDLWKFNLPQSHNLTTYINTIPKNFKDWKKLEANLEKTSKRKEMGKQGAFLLNYIENMINWLVENRSEEVKFAGRRVLVVNNSYKPITSQLGHALYQKHPPLSIVWSERAGQRNFSLRSNGKINVAKIAEKYGGGGHPAAAGFSLPADKPLPWKN